MIANVEPKVFAGRPILLHGPEATVALARHLAPAVRSGDTLLLFGPIGAGKTHFARALIQALFEAAGQPAEDVPSPTFTLVQTYYPGALEVWHADLFRLAHPDELLELGLEAALGEALCLIEWPERLGAQTPPDALSLRLLPVEAGEAREAHIGAAGYRGMALAQHLAAARLDG